jgi:hypothetical protein
MVVLGYAHSTPLPDRGTEAKKMGELERGIRGKKKYDMVTYLYPSHRER